MSYRIVFQPSLDKLGQRGISTTSTSATANQKLLDLRRFFGNNYDQMLNSIVTWANGADLDPDVLYSCVTGEPIPQFDVKSTAF